VRATLPSKPKVEGIPALEAGVDYRDIFPPPTPSRIDALSEGNAVRLVWEPVVAADLAGYVVFRAEGEGAAVRLTEKPISDTFLTDTTVQPGRRYRYTVVAVDLAGNTSASSPEAVAETF
jgi:fibronectin type 3 domain-containing protein